MVILLLLTADKSCAGVADRPDAQQHAVRSHRTIRIYDEAGILVAEAPRTTTRSVASFKVRKVNPTRAH